MRPTGTPGTEPHATGKQAAVGEVGEAERIRVVCVPICSGDCIEMRLLGLVLVMRTELTGLTGREN